MVRLVTAWTAVWWYGPVGTGKGHGKTGLFRSWWGLGLLFCRVVVVVVGGGGGGSGGVFVGGGGGDVCV